MMRNRALGMWLFAALGVMVALAGFGLAAEPVSADQKAAQLLTEGMRLYQTGQNEKAKEAFQQVLALNPSSKAAREMFDKIDLNLLVKMYEAPELLNVAELLLKLRYAAYQATMRNVQDMAAAIQAFKSPDLRAYLSARAVVLGHGPYAVPQMLELLALSIPAPQAAAASPIRPPMPEEVAVTRAIATLTAMRHDICMPLIAALATDNALLRARICAILGQIGDQRAVPALLALLEKTDTPQDVAKEASEALKAITGQDPSTLGNAVQQYEQIILLYMKEDAATVGYTFGDWTEVWQWAPVAKALPDKLTYETVPRYLYYQRQGAQLALQALRLDAAAINVQAMLVALQVRQLKLTSLAAQEGLDPQAAAEAVYRRDKLAADTPVICHLYGADVVGMALEHAINLSDGTSALYLVRQLMAEMNADQGPAAMALDRALKMPDKDVRYYAAVAITTLSPNGHIGDPRKAVRVMAAALRYTAARNALLAFDNLQVRNRLAAALKELGLNTLDANMSSGTILKVLDVEPAVDVVFVDGNSPDAVMKEVMELLTKDARTRAAPLYVVRDPAQPPADLAPYDTIDAILTPDHLRAVELAPLVKPAVEERPAPFAVERGQLVLLAAQTVQVIDPSTTRYDLSLLEPSLAAALTGYALPVQMAAAACLQRFGSEVSLPALTHVVNTSKTPELTAAACYGVAAIAARSGAPLPDNTMQALKQALASGPEPVRQAASEALGRGGLGAKAVGGLVQPLAEPNMAAMPAVAPPAEQKPAAEDAKPQQPADKKPDQVKPAEDKPVNVF